MKETNPINENVKLRNDIDYLKKKIKKLERENTELKKNLKYL